ncbi:MAG TPA: M48 family metalloprotease [Steroidobacteraceae bacterium]|jgi:predicted Zn-dependent protease|nr:M48 family metalloprotease [Steroidobacteraceae bacterium]
MSDGLKRFLIALLSALLPLQALAQSTANDLPDIGSPASSALTIDDEYHIGLQVMRQLRDEGQIIEDPEATEYLQALGSRIVAQASGDSAQRFSFFFVRDNTINAFALPGGFVGVNYGLVLATRNEAQLAGVLAHEIAHVTQRHIARRVRSQGRQSIATVAAILASILVGAATGSGDAALGGIAMAQGAAMQQSINFTRANENEADRVGMSFLAAAGFDPYGMPDFFETMGRRSAISTNSNSRNALPEILQSHPVTANRIAESRARAAQFTNTKQTAESVSYLLTRERLRVLATPIEDNVRRYYSERREQQDQTVGERYGEALASYQAGSARASLDALLGLARAYPQVPMLQSTLGQAQMAAGDTDDALATFRRALNLSPRNIPLTMRYAEALLKNGDAKTAHAVLLDLFNNVTPTPEQIRFTALAASSAGDNGDAAYYMSEYHITTGNLPLSVAQLEMALAAPNITAVQRSRYQARLDEVREALFSDRKRRDTKEREQRPPEERTRHPSANRTGTISR